MHITDRSIAERLGISVTFVNMLRRGKRTPGPTTMLAIERVFGWKMQDQVKAAEEGTYASGFAAAVAPEPTPAETTA